ncbi:hypothetical protein EHI8A_040950 [Entamoeba histolytica HM-1:IMSS-B]|uniref:Uncharacterized protein n=5 Tax=Entamoeba histolytica TaxID=5759 RepID=C4M303_ENTH1|nr:hypothetical protein EHI_074140 [Entamoeba histolytica HM-1:IMSS]EMD46355.1 Hypothetical protein EHI5A_072840 [Entamoeba histolytica KU27]EMH77776.1 hypothetical protein EHI8A_040950 [Entamoeba histolytica HM-1:IMSS-B]ENY64905.1 hypothetical protein EHI7A_042100 [Entamoeba histolytica HM-1:IMSS-A]GAT95677.1 hypothetical protein CL6EHI_074140 [Entamoeba histolytica]EAL48168.1 hypothetical protein EHI_074140 [Entamoeba histolytica HM-1:IMSS]|eukprot:XP_653555.1 hypothetical protein EHI_074140 [Entamoeba histolytica HM-1:IMSS]
MEIEETPHAWTLSQTHKFNIQNEITEIPINLFVIPSNCETFCYLIVSYSFGFNIYKSNQTETPIVPITQYSYNKPIIFSFLIRSTYSYTFELWFIFKNEDNSLRMSFVSFDPFKDGLITDPGSLSKYVIKQNDIITQVEQKDNILALISFNRLIVIRGHEQIANKLFKNEITAMTNNGRSVFIGFINGDLVEYSIMSESLTEIFQHHAPITSITYTIDSLYVGTLDGKLHIHPLVHRVNSRKKNIIELDGSAIYTVYSNHLAKFPLIVLCKKGIHVITTQSNEVRFTPISPPHNTNVLTMGVNLEIGVIGLLCDNEMTLYSI